MTVRRVWAMPSRDTFDCKPIGAFVQKYLAESKVSIDPFARNKRWATFTNDLNPDTAAEYHLEAREFLDMLIARGVRADLAILDPPYSQVEVSRQYAGVGREYKPFGNDNNAVLYREVKDRLAQLVDGVVLTFAWNSSGMGKGRGFALEEIMLVCHGGAHNDTICMAERKQPRLVE
jgi:hypothetical protein